MKASVIIIAKNQKHFLQKTIPILQKQNKKVEIIIVDSNSNDGTLEYLNNEDVIVVEYDSSHFNFSHAFNIGAERANGDILVRLSGDAIPHGKTAIEELLKPFKDSKVGGTFGKYVISGKLGLGYPEFWPASRFPEKETRYHVKPPFLAGVSIFGWEINRKHNSEIFNFAGGFCAVRKYIWENRPFNEDVWSGEDAEYAWYLHMNRYDIVYTPKAEALHEHPVTKQQTKSLVDFLNLWQFIFNWQIVKAWLEKYTSQKKIL